MAGLTIAQAQETPLNQTGNSFQLNDPAVTPAQALETHAAGQGEQLHATTEDLGGHESTVFPPFDPSTFPSQLLWLAITFVALYLLMSRAALPRIGSILEDRKARIDGDLAEADALRQQTDAAIASYESALAAAKKKAHGIAEASREANKAELAAKRAGVETDLAAKMAGAETRINQTKLAALANVDEIAADTAQALVAQLAGDVSPEQARSAVARVKE